MKNPSRLCRAQNKKGVKFYVDSSSVLQFVFLVVLIALSAFFSSAETALTTVNRVRVRTLIEEGNKRAVILQKILDNYSKMLSSILIGNNVVNLSASALTTTLAMKIWGNYAVSIATGILTLVVLLCGEIVPKNAATLSSEKISLAYARVVYTLMKLLTPLIFIVDRLSEIQRSSAYPAGCDRRGKSIRCNDPADGRRS